MGEGSHKYGIGQGNRPRRDNPRKKPALSAKQRLEAEERRKRGMARLKAKSDIDAGLNESERKSLKAHGDEIRGKNIEHMRILNSNGELVFKNIGDRGSVTYSRNAARGNMMTHNHPGASYGDRGSLAGRIGTSFSGADLGGLVAYGGKGIRAETQGYTFDAKRTSSTKNVSSRTVDKFHTQTFKRQFSEYLKGYVLKAKTNEDMVRRHDRALTLAAHKATEETAKKYGLKYTRRKK